jgi:putative transposase
MEDDMSAIKIADAAWRKMYAFLRSHPHVYTGQEAAWRRFVEGVHWVLRSGAQWRELPAHFGNWNSVYRRFARWEVQGVWADLHQAFAQDPDMESVMLDSTVIRAHMCAAGGSKKTVAKLNKHSDAVKADSAPRSMS